MTKNKYVHYLLVLLYTSHRLCKISLTNHLGQCCFTTVDISVTVDGTASA